MPSGSPETYFLEPTHSAFRGEIFLVLHGLNLHPDRMAPWSELLRAQGFAVAQIGLAGHDPAHRRAWGAVTAEQWSDDVSRACSQARSRWPGAAVSLCGYSLGAVAGLAWSAERGVLLNRALLIAPALRVRSWLSPLLRLSGYWLQGRVRLPSLAPRSYRAHRSTSLAAFRALQETIDRFEAGAERLLACPQLVIYAEGDELISTQYLLEYRERHRHSVSLLLLKLPAARRYPRHLAIDARTMGDAEWARVAAHVGAWLSTPAGSRMGKINPR